MYKYLFGPVPSRRLGMSLGVDLVPHKVCTLDCVYCECGATTKLTTDRKEYILFEKVREELVDYFKKNPAPDYITFSGAGEPTLNSRFGEVLDFIKINFPSIPLAVLTNGSLLSDPQVRKELMHADVVLPSLDSASEKSFNMMDRPSTKLTVDSYIQGLVDFKKEFKGEIWLETMILPGYNDSIEDLKLLKEAFLKINPDSIQINTLDRPGTLENLRPANKAELNEIVKFWDMDIVQIIAAAPDRKKIIAYREDVETSILETISRRPCTLDDIAKILGTHVNEVNKYLGVLEDDDKIETTRLERGVFYQLKK
ncbi:MAG: radical SAM protein [Bacteroidota bacterium]|nr:radical SAM protein [Bacteroidota bacterium]